MIRVIGSSYIIRKVNCKNCHSILEYDDRDIKTTRKSDNSIIFRVYRKIDCPVCSMEVKL